MNRDDGGKRRFTANYDGNTIVSLAAVQGHSGAAHAMLDDDQHLPKIVNAEQIPRICMHGTRKHHVDYA